MLRHTQHMKKSVNNGNEIYCNHFYEKEKKMKRLRHCFLPDSHASLTKLLHRLAWFNTPFWAANHPAASANQSATTAAANQSATINIICVRNQKSGCHVVLTFDIYSNGGNGAGNGVMFSHVT